VAAVRRTPVLVLVALLLLGVGWALAPRSALPLYDGVGFPDDPYRFVVAPKGAPRNPAPTSAHGSATVQNGRAGRVTVATDENAPQISLEIPAGRLAVAGPAQLTVTATPVRPLPTASGQYLWSNVYEVTASPRADFRPGGVQATITLRAATAQRPVPHIAYYAGGQWHLLPTFLDGQDIYIAELSQFGRFAVVGTAPLDVTQLRGANKGSGGASSTGLVVGIGAVVVVVGLFLVGVWRRGRTRSVDEDETEDVE
jgi:hypothetical protein